MIWLIIALLDYLLLIWIRGGRIQRAAGLDRRGHGGSQ
jgi:hypothetical protein